MMRSQASESTSVRAGAQVVEMQRRRLLTATVEVMFEHGAQTLTVATICGRAGLSRRTFYSLYEEREELFAAAFDDALDRARRSVLEQVAAERSWLAQVRMGLLALLGFLDVEPAVGRLLVVDALVCGEPTLEARGRILAELAKVVDRGRVEMRVSGAPPPLTAEGVVGAVLAVIHARMLQRDHEPLLELAGPLTAMIVQPYLGAAAAQREIDHPVPVEPSGLPKLPKDPFKDLPIRLTYRTVRALSAIAERPGSSNKQVADAAGVSDVGQTSKLLNRLQRYGLIEDDGIGPTKGLPRAWSLTQRGEGVLHAVSAN